MDSSSSQSANPSDRYSHRLADIVGTAIALLTLTLPIWVIGYYSSSTPTLGQPINPLQRDVEQLADAS